MDDAELTQALIRTARRVLEDAKTRGISESNEDAAELAQLVLKWFVEE